MENIASLLLHVLHEARLGLEAAEDRGSAEVIAARQRARTLLARVRAVASSTVREQKQQGVVHATALKRQRAQDGDDASLAAMNNVRHRLEGSESTARRRHGGECSSISVFRSIEDSVADVMSTGRGVVAVKAPPTTSSIPQADGVVASIRADQSALRRQLYLGQRRNDVAILTSSSSRCGVDGRHHPLLVVPPLPTPPTEAVRLVASLNVEAECAFLQRAIWVDTKVALLMGWDQLQDTLRSISRRRAEYFSKTGFPDAALPRADATDRWFHVGACNEGVVQIVVRRALCVTLCWARHTNRWDLRDCEWLVQQPSGVNGEVSLVAIAEQQLGAVVQQLRLAFARSFVDGCCMCLDAAAGIWLECAELQFNDHAVLDPMLQSVCNGSSESITHSVDLQPNSNFIAVRVAPSPLGQLSACQTKFFVLEHSLFHQRSIGTDTSLSSLVDVLDAATHATESVVVDASRRLLEDWRACVAANNSRQD